MRFILAVVTLRLGEIPLSKLLRQKDAVSAGQAARVTMDNEVQMPVVQFQKNFFSSPGSLCTAIFFPSLCAPSYEGISWPLVKATFSFR